MESKKAKLFCGVMYAKKEIYLEAVKELGKRFGKIELEGEEYRFDFTDSYLKEFGPNLRKRFVVFEIPIEREALPEIKNWTCGLEKKLSREDRRQVNLDPGYITPINVVVASTKDFPHRVYLSRGIFGDVQLILKKNDAVTFRHTFADYTARKDFFLGLRKKAPK